MANRRIDKRGEVKAASSGAKSADPLESASPVDELAEALASLTAARQAHAAAVKAAQARRDEDQSRIQAAAKAMSLAEAEVTTIGAKYRQGFALAPADLREAYIHAERRIGDLKGEVAEAQSHLRELEARAGVLESKLSREAHVAVASQAVACGVPGSYQWKVRENASSDHPDVRAVSAILEELADIRTDAAAACRRIDAALEAIDATTPQLKAAELKAVEAGLARLRGPVAAAG